jgi:hypothetical protein
MYWHGRYNVLIFDVPICRLAALTFEKVIGG